MSDSENEVTNMFGYPNMSTTVSARGPNTNITNLSIRSQMTSTMYMPRNFERQRYAESVYDQRSMYRRETSPMSIQSACDMRPRNFQPYYRGMSSQRSVINGRSGSPMSMRSMDSTASVSAADIAFAFKNVKFNKHDLKLIKDAYHKLMKQRIRKRIEKRRNLRLFLKGNRRRSGDDSGDQGSDSSISSDDGRSVKTSYKENMSSYKPTNIDIMDFRRNVNDSNMLKDCTENFKQSTFRNMFSIGAGSVNGCRQNKSVNNLDGTLVQKDRFKNSFLLPSQRFNKSVASLAIPENLEKPCKNYQSASMHNVKNHHFQKTSKNMNKQCEASDEEIFFVNDKTTNQSKRSIECDGKSLPNNKKAKLSSPVKNASKKKTVSKNTNSEKEKNGTNFEFAVPTLPVKKGKSKVPEKLIAKSAPALDLIENDVEKLPNVNTEVIVKEKTANDSQPDPDSTDVSLCPSFIKRKLFTQKLDVTEKANISSDSTNSPQSIHNVAKEKNKTRRLVTSQSCLSREVQDDSNLLDLIHKIVPPDRMNATSQTSMINSTKATNKSKKDDDRWDVTSVLSTINDEDVSDTFTDEEIFVNDDKTKKNTEKRKAQESIKKANMSATFTDEEEIFVADAKNPSGNVKKNGKVEAKVDAKSTKKESKTAKGDKIKEPTPVIDQILNTKPVQKQVTSNKENKLTSAKVIKPNGISKPKVITGTKSFWDTDIESDMECYVPLQRTILRPTNILGNMTINKNTTQQEEAKDETIQHTRNEASNNVVPTAKSINKTVMNNTVDTVQKFNLNISNITIKSHRTVKKKKCEETAKNKMPKNSPKKKNSPNTKKLDTTKNRSVNTSNLNVTSSRPNTRLNTSRNPNTNSEINTEKSTTASKPPKSAQKKLKTVEKKDTPRAKNKPESKVKSTKPKVSKNISLKETNKSILSFLNTSRPNTRLNASKDNVQLNPKTKSTKTTNVSPNNKIKNIAKEPKSNQNTKLKSTKVKSPRNMQKTIPSVNDKFNTKYNLQQKVQHFNIKSPLTITPRRMTPRRR